MKNIILTLIALACVAFAAPVYALDIVTATTQFAQGGCNIGANGNQCSLKPVTTAERGHLTTPSTGPAPTTCDGRIGYWDITSFQWRDGHWTCYAAINPHNSGGAYVVDAAGTCSVTTREIAHDSRAPFLTGWSVSSSTAKC
jgi:hypothetical protein